MRRLCIAFACGLFLENAQAAAEGSWFLGMPGRNVTAQALQDFGQGLGQRLPQALRQNPMKTFKGVVALASDRQVAQLTRKVSATLPAGGGACTCLNWAQVYASNAVRCGNGRETYQGEVEHGFSHSEAIRKDDDMCKGVKFFQQQKHSYCIKEAQLPGYEQEWCYVSSGCTVLRGGAKVNSWMGWKYCSQGRDPALGELAPSKLMEMSASQQMDPTILAAMAYPVASELWDNSESGPQEQDTDDSKAPEVFSKKHVLANARRLTHTEGGGLVGRNHSLTSSRPKVAWEQLYGSSYLVTSGSKEVWYLNSQWPTFNVSCIQGCADKTNVEIKLPGADDKKSVIRHLPRKLRRSWRRSRAAKNAAAAAQTVVEKGMAALDAFAA